MKAIALAYTLIMAGISSAVMVAIHTGAHRSTMPCVDMLAVPALWAAGLIITSRPDRNPTPRDNP